MLLALLKLFGLSGFWRKFQTKWSSKKSCSTNIKWLTATWKEKSGLLFRRKNSSNFVQFKPNGASLIFRTTKISLKKVEKILFQWFATSWMLFTETATKQTIPAVAEELESENQSKIMVLAFWTNNGTSKLTKKFNRVCKHWTFAKDLDEKFELAVMEKNFWISGRKDIET